MRDVQDLSAQARQGTGKGPAYQARQQGFIPAVVYGGKSAPENVSVDGRTLERQIEKGGFLTSLFMLDVAGKKQRVIPREVQLDPVTDRPVHIDFMRLEKGAKFRLAVPVRFKGQDTSPGIKLGGVLNIVRHDIEMIVSADNIPAAIEIDLSALGIHDTVHIQDVTMPEGAKPVNPRNFTVASIVAPTSVIEEQKAAAAAAKAAANAPVAAEGAAPAEGAAAAPGAAPAAGAAAAAPAAGAKAPAAGAKPPAAKK